MIKNRLFIGNPGPAKSTLVNCIAKKVLFKGGHSFDSAESVQLEKKEHNGIMYLDTPGSADINGRIVAAQKITEGLRQNGMYQIFFVVSLSAGRIRLEDLKTIWLVLMSTPDIKILNILINQLSKEEYDSFQNIEEMEKSRLLATLKLLGRDLQYNILPVLNNETFEDNDEITARFADLDNFVRELPWESIRSSGVKDISEDDDVFNEQINSKTDEIINVSEDQLLIRVRKLLLFCSSQCFFII